MGVCCDDKFGIALACGKKAIGKFPGSPEESKRSNGTKCDVGLLKGISRMPTINSSIEGLSNRAAPDGLDISPSRGVRHVMHP